MLSIYIHIPFCKTKCPYCDFYSARPTEEAVMDEYTRAVCERVKMYGERYAHRTVGTVYFGGGTPSVIGAERLCSMLSAVKSAFSVIEMAEITAECNPADGNEKFFTELKSGGFNRISMGMQSANADELKCLGRRHSAEDVRMAVNAARGAGFDNISVDLMLALPNSSTSTLERSISFCEQLGADHVSAYILKIEPGTPFAAAADSMVLPDDDGAADQYLFMVERLRALGYEQYEISNFTRPDKESRHNLQYWRCGEYIGIGPAAHSFVDGKRFFYPRDMESFMQGNEPVYDGDGGGFAEYAMLVLRLSEGLRRESCEKRFSDGAERYNEVLGAAMRLPKQLVHSDEDGIALTAEGFLVSNTILAEILPDD